MRKEVVGLDAAVEVGGFRVTPVVRLTVTWVEAGDTVSFHASKQPIYLIVESGTGLLALSAEGGVVDLDRVLSDCPAIREGLAGRCSALRGPGR